ncbi:hypothetical protein [Bradyrhizobium sp. AZCC 1719]|uniref:hypothetical protein n=1 Tax=Bradyrhizobium sp. AZCC 1719 TaxID=3117028 RepID=UPI002FF31ECB
MAMHRALLLSCVLMTATSMAGAQAPPSPATPPAQTAPPSPDRAAANCAPMQPAPNSGATVPEGKAREGTTTGQRAEPLGDKLARSEGVLCPPPGVDPEIHAPTPEDGKTPVIPPPGTPGGDPSIRPK